MTIFFTSDTHFGHAAIIRSCGRPYASVEEMDAALIASWNDIVGPGDTVWHLGDFAFRNEKSPADYRRKLNGEIHLIVGNHDGRTVPAHADLFASVSDIERLDAGGRRIVLCHYPMREWPGAFRGDWHLFGHVHSGYDGSPWGYSMDVGVDSNGYRPISLDEVGRQMEDRENPFRGDRRRVRPTFSMSRGEA